MTNGDCKGLEPALGPVVIVLSPQAVNVQCCPASLRKALQTMGDHLAAQIANFLPPQPQLNNAVWSVAQIDDGAR